MQKVLNKIKPSNEEAKQVKAKVDTFLKRLNSKLLNGEAIVAGSFAKDTWLKGNHDIDIFVIFNKELNMATRLEVVIRALFDKEYEKIHGSRDYFIVNYEGLNFELIPVLKINSPEEAKNITDISPLHAKYVKRKTDEKLRDDIRLTKQFMEANKCYGAETFIGGFSGYLAELLIIHYGSFSKLIKTVSEWDKEVIIDIESKNKFDIY